jgi:hypothetical protein
MYEDLNGTDQDQIENLKADNEEMALTIKKTKKQLKRKRIAVQEILAEHIEHILFLKECQLWIHTCRDIIKSESKGGTLFDPKLMMDLITKETKKKHLAWVKEYHNIDEIRVKAVLSTP